MLGRKFELEYFLNQYGVDIFLLSQTFLNVGQAFRFSNYVFHHTGLPTVGGGTSILVRRGVVHHSVSFSGSNHLKATTIQLILSRRPLKILAA
jgi:hypothetical protein